MLLLHKNVVPTYYHVYIENARDYYSVTPTK